MTHLRAEGELERIRDYGAEVWGPNQAVRYTDVIRDAHCAVAGGLQFERGGNCLTAFFGWFDLPLRWIGITSGVGASVQ